MSSSLDEVTSASATSALVSETRAIGVPVSRMVDRPTIRVTLSFAGPAAVTRELPRIAMTKMSAPSRVDRDMSILLADDFARTLVAADDFDGGGFRRGRRLLDHGAHGR